MEYPEIKHSCKLAADKEVRFQTAVFVDDKGLNSRYGDASAVKGEIGVSQLKNAEIRSSEPAFSAVIVDGGKYTVEDTSIELLSASDGREVCDFVGLGSAIDAFSGASVAVKNCDIRTEGVAKCAFFVDEGSDLVAENCKISVMGGKLYEGYVNSADFNYMVAPPWVLGIKGNARGTNLMGDKASTALIDCDIKAANWGVLSTDNGEDNLLTVADCTLTLTGTAEEQKKNPYFKKWGSGYGTYILGCHEAFYGVRMDVGTFIGIARDGSAEYRSSNGVIRHVSPTTGQVLYEKPGKGQKSVLNSDGFGIMAHGWARITVSDKTEMNTEEASFLMRSGGVRIRVEDGAVLQAASGVIVQVMDDDDMTVGVDWENKSVEMAFHTEFREKEGWPSENGQITSMMPPSPPPPPPPLEEGEEPPPPPEFDVHFTASDVVLDGNLYNGSGYYGQKAKQLYVVLERGAVLNGAVSATETIHVDENGKQNTYFTAEEYYYLGHVKNRVFYNGDNEVEVVINDGAVWNVKDTGILTSLTVMPGGRFAGKLFADGQEVSIEYGRTYTGKLEVKAL